MEHIFFAFDYFILYVNLSENKLERVRFPPYLTANKK
jgi:hypothetical protein